MRSNDLNQTMSKILANTYSLYLKTQNYHWNVTGPQFMALHTMFEEQYKELAEAVDTLAELIRGRGLKVPASFKVFDAYATLQPGDENAHWDRMIQDLIQDNKFMEDLLINGITLAQTEGDEVIADALINRQNFHRKVRWMLESSL